MHAVVALTTAHLLDQLRRASTVVLAVIGLLLIVSLRYFSAFGLGYEVVQLKEMAVYTIGLLCLVAVFLACLQRDDDGSEGTDIQLLTRPIGTPAIALGSFLGRLACLAFLCAIWTLAVYAALGWFKLGDPRVFGYRGATSAFAEGHAVLAPVFSQWLCAAVLLALAQPLSRARKPVLLACGLAGLYVAGFAATALGEPWTRILPDLSRYDTTPVLWGSAAQGLSGGLIFHAIAWCAVGLAIDSGVLRTRVAS